MKPLTAVLALCACGWIGGCGATTTPEETLPGVKLVSREPAEDMISVRFVFTNLDRASWKNRVLKAAIVRSGDTPPAEAQEFKNPPKDFAIQLTLAKGSGSETVFFGPMWGPASEGLFLVKGEPLKLLAPDARTDEVNLTGLAENRINQVMELCSGPGRSIPFDPDKGIDLLTVGYKPDAYCLHVWAAKPSEKPTSSP